MHKMTYLFFFIGLTLAMVFSVLVFRTTPHVRAAVGTVTIDQSVGGTVTLGTVDFQKIQDSANTAYFLDPAATGDSLVVAGTATASGNLTVGNTNAIRSAFGPLSLQYKSALNAWTTGLTLQDTTGNVGIGTTGPNAKLEVSGITFLTATNNDSLGQLSVRTTGTSGHDAQISFSTAANSRGLYVDDSDSNKLKFYSGYGKGVAGKEITFDNEGNVGIGTTTPSTALQVVGTITGTTKNFEIDHPTKSGMKLIHSTLEGPEVAVFYRGEARLTNGRAIIALPDYFEALVRREGRTVQLTAKNGWSPLYVDGEVTNGRFTVKADSGNPSQQFFWEVKAVRADVAPLVMEKSVNQP